MTPLRLVAVGAIFLCTTIGWMILGGTIDARTGESDGRLRSEVEALWGSEHRQLAPTVTVERSTTRRITTNNVVNGATVSATSEQTASSVQAGDLDGSDVDVRLDLEHRKKGLLWWPTYTVDFKGHYRFALPEPGAVGVDVTALDEAINIVLPMSAHGAVYDGFFIKLDGHDVKTTTTRDNTFIVTVPRGRRTAVDVDVAYHSRGLGTWVYSLAGGGTAQLRNFALTLASSAANVDFPIGTLSPSTRTTSDSGAVLQWRFASLVTGQDIGVELPARLNPGPVAARISYFAPVSLLFFLTVMVIVGVINQRSLHPMNHFFLAAAFFAFHLLFAYLVDVVDLAVAFAVSSVVSLGLVTSYLRIVQGAKAAFLQAGTAQLIFLVGFSLAFFHEGQTGLTIAIGSVVTLFVLMQLTARVRWTEVFGGVDVDMGPIGGAPVGVPGLTGVAVATSPTDNHAD
jgi:inner membrane protein involved in colicin E2 resistance